MGIITQMLGVVMLALPLSIIGANFHEEREKMNEDNALEEMPLIDDRPRFYSLITIWTHNPRFYSMPLIDDRTARFTLNLTPNQPPVNSKLPQGLA